jgi:hypothetical protein
MPIRWLRVFRKRRAVSKLIYYLLALSALGVVLEEALLMLEELVKEARLLEVVVPQVY